MLGRWSFRGTRRVASHDAARQRLARLGAGPEPVSAGSESVEPEAVEAEVVEPVPRSESVPASGVEAEAVPASGPEPVPRLEPVLPAEETAAAEEWPAPLSPVIGAGRHAARPLSRRARVWGTLSDRLSPSMRSAMDGTFSGHHLGVLAVVLATGIAITAWWVLSGRPEQQPVPTVSFGSASPGASVAPDTPAASDPSVSTSAASPSVTGASVVGEQLIVDVAGKVRRPGIVTLPPGSRVFDALRAAGGARPGVDLTSLNLARVLVDGEQLLVGLAPVVLPSPGSTATAGPSATGLVNINTADQVALETLPGVGPVTAQAILDWRADNGAFTSVDELLEVDGIGEVTLDELRDLVTV